MLPLYQDHIDDEWTDFLADVYKYGRNQWHYQFPEDPAQLEIFRRLCETTLAFENHVVSSYVDYLRGELASGDHEMARERLPTFEL